MTVNIFSDENKIKGNWFKTVTPRVVDATGKIITEGDSLQGTYISKFKSKKFGSEELQDAYAIMKEDGEVWNVSGKPGIAKQMQYVKLGQIVGFTYIGEGKAPPQGGNKAKLVQVFANKNVVNQAWIEENEARLTQEAMGETNRPADIDYGTDKQPGQIAVEEIPYTPPTTPVTPVTPVAPTMDKVAEIASLAVTKLGASTDDQQMRMKVMEKTNLAFIAANYDKILKMLKSE